MSVDKHLQNDTKCSFWFGCTWLPCQFAAVLVCNEYRIGLTGRHWFIWHCSQLCRKQVTQQILLVRNKFSILSNMLNVGSRCRQFLDKLIWSEYFEFQLSNSTVSIHNFVQVLFVTSLRAFRQLKPHFGGISQFDMSDRDWTCVLPDSLVQMTTAGVHPCRGVYPR